MLDPDQYETLKDASQFSIMRQFKIITVRCTQCRSVMNFQWDGTDLSKKKKRCVYCGKSFTLSQ